MAILKAFYLHSGRGDLKLNIPILQTNITKWGKSFTTKQAKVFTKQELKAYHDFPDTPESLLKKIHAVVSVGVSGRETEVISLEFGDFRKQ